MSVSKTARSVFLGLGFIVAIAAIGLGVYSLWDSRDSFKNVLGDADSSGLKEFADEASEAVRSIQEKSNLGDVGEQLDALKEKLSQFAHDAGPAVKKRLDEMRSALESAAESFNRRAKDFPDRLAEVAEAAKSLGADREEDSGSGD